MTDGPKPAAAISTRATLRADLHSMGVAPGDIVCLHVSMKAIGLVIGGPRAIVEATMDAVAPGGTVMMPAYSGDLSDPAEWRHPPVPAERLAEIRTHMPAYDPARTPTRGMGKVAEYFRTYPGALRSPHPQSSFAAVGPHAEALTGRHPYDNRFGPESPLGRLTEMGGKVLLLGAPFDSASLFHLTQHLVGPSPVVPKSAPVVERGERRWARYNDIEYPIAWFETGARALISAKIAATGRIGAAPSVLFPAAAAVSFLIEWRKKNGFLPGQAGADRAAS